MFADLKILANFLWWSSHRDCRQTSFHMLSEFKRVNEVPPDTEYHKLYVHQKYK